ncbi:hypothetical protein [Streptomyces sp. HF10]|uniref:hypothetical protein n=1 Tax=Streptomyces sp. HF10 TaxID=2692233 RepID=UPI0013185975|nr:hypothetical protein [Streptomyces sp. HF10]QHC32880.1 hypothetical protein GR129_32980 [Streptomyces sp. HF10]
MGRQADCGRRTTAHAPARAALTAPRGDAVCAPHLADRAVTRRIAALQAAPQPGLGAPPR